MTHSTKCAPAGAGTPAGANEPVTHKIGDSPAMLDQDVTYEKVTCTGDVWCGCECHACTVSFEHCDTGPLTVPTLLVEADQHLAGDPLVYQLAARIAHGSPAFPLQGYSCYVTEFDRSRFTITATRRDPQTRDVTNREFTAMITEVK